MNYKSRIFREVNHQDGDGEINNNIETDNAAMINANL